MSQAKIKKQMAKREARRVEREARRLVREARWGTSIVGRQTRWPAMPMVFEDCWKGGRWSA